MLQDMGERHTASFYQLIREYPAHKAEILAELEKCLVEIEEARVAYKRLNKTFMDTMTPLDETNYKRLYTNLANEHF